MRDAEEDPGHLSLLNGIFSAMRVKLEEKEIQCSNIEFLKLHRILRNDTFFGYSSSVNCSNAEVRAISALFIPKQPYSVNFENEMSSNDLDIIVRHAEVGTNFNSHFNAFRGKMFSVQTMPVLLLYFRRLAAFEEGKSHSLLINITVSGDARIVHEEVLNVTFPSKSNNRRMLVEFEGMADKVAKLKSDLYTLSISTEQDEYKLPFWFQAQIGGEKDLEAVLHTFELDSFCVADNEGNTHLRVDLPLCTDVEWSNHLGHWL